MSSQGVVRVRVKQSPLVASKYLFVKSDWHLNLCALLSRVCSFDVNQILQLTCFLFGMPLGTFFRHHDVDLTNVRLSRMHLSHLSQMSCKSNLLCYLDCDGNTCQIDNEHFLFDDFFGHLFGQSW